MFSCSSPLEQFQILILIPFQIFFLDLSLTNNFLIFFFAIGIFFSILFSLITKSNFFLIVPNSAQNLIESLYILIYNLILDNSGSSSKPFLPYIFTFFVFILISNVVGLIPYSFTLTSHLVVAFFLALTGFIAVTIISIKLHGIQFFSFFLPSGSSFYLAFLLIPIEIVSYFFRPISLSVRLFANMMAGHTLLKVIAGFSWTMLLSGGGLLIAHFLPLVILTILMFLEFGVALIQSYVFSILSCIYLNDALHLH